MHLVKNRMKRSFLDKFVKWGLALALLVPSMSWTTATYAGPVGYTPATPVAISGIEENGILNKVAGTATLSNGNRALLELNQNVGDQSSYAPWPGYMATVRLYDSTGVLLSTLDVGEVENSGDSVNQASIAPLKNGGFVVVWTAIGSGGAGLAPYYELYDNNGNPMDGAPVGQRHHRLHPTANAGADGGLNVIGLDDGGFASILTENNGEESFLLSVFSVQNGTATNVNNTQFGGRSLIPTAEGNRNLYSYRNPVSLVQMPDGTLMMGTGTYIQYTPPPGSSSTPVGYWIYKFSSTGTPINFTNGYPYQRINTTNFASTMPNHIVNLGNGNMMILVWTFDSPATPQLVLKKYIYAPDGTFISNETVSGAVPSTVGETRLSVVRSGSKFYAAIRSNDDKNLSIGEFSTTDGSQIGTWLDSGIAAPTGGRYLDNPYLLADGNGGWLAAYDDVSYDSNIGVYTSTSYQSGVGNTPSNGIASNTTVDFNTTGSSWGDLSLNAQTDLHGVSIMENGFWLRYRTPELNNHLLGVGNGGQAGGPAIQLKGGSTSGESLIIAHTQGKSFSFGGFYLNKNGASLPNLTITGWKNGTLIGSQNVTTTSSGLVSVGSNSNGSNLSNVDTIAVSAANTGFDGAVLDSFAFGAPVSSNTLFTVVNTNDSGVGSLRWAIEQAGAVSGGEVNFDPSLAGQTITLQSNLTGFDTSTRKSTTIGDASTNGFKLTGLKDAAGLPNITIDGNGHWGILATGTGSFEISDVRMTGFDITNSTELYDAVGSALGVGGYDYSQINISNVIFDHNTMSSKKTSSIVSLNAQVAPYQVNLDRVSFIENSVHTTSPDEAAQNAALYFNGYVNSTISNSLFANNTSNSQSAVGAYGAAIGTLSDPQLKIWNNTFYNNVVNNSGGDAFAPIGYAVKSASGSSHIEIYNNLMIGNRIKGNTVSTLSDLFLNFNNEAVIADGNNLYTGSPFVNAAGGDYRLSASASSAIDQGNNAKVVGTLDLSAKTRTNNNTVDLGAYEYVPTATAATLQSATADGAAGTTTSTKIDLTFDVAVSGLTDSDITLTDGTGAAVKGVLTGAGTSWSIALNSVTTEGNISVAVNAPNGYTLSGSPKTVAVYKASANASLGGIYYLTNDGNSSAAGAGDALKRIMPDGSGDTTIAEGVAFIPGDLTLDIASKKGYFLDVASSGPKINSIDLTTGAVQTIKTLSQPPSYGGIQYNPIDGYLYFMTNGGTNAAEAGDQLVKIKPNGSGETTISSSVASIVGDLTLDIVGNKAYFFDAFTSSPAIKSVDLTQPSLSTFKTLSTAPTYAGIQYNPADGYLYFMENDGASTLSANDKFKKISTDGTDESIIASSVAAIMGDLTLNIEANEGYFIDAGSSSKAVKAINLSTGNIRTLTTLSQLPSYAGIAYTPGEVVSLDLAASSPANQASNVNAADNLQLKFNHKVARGVTGNFVLKDVTSNSSLETISNSSLQITGWGTDSLTLNPTNNLPAGHSISVTWDNAVVMDYYNSVIPENTSDSYYTFTVGGSSTSPEATPTATIDYTNETLNGLVAGASYTFNSVAATADANGKVTINPLWLGSSVSIIKKGNGSTTTDSSAQSLTVPLRPTAPNGVGKTDETATAANDGSLTGVSSAMEYRLGSSGPWTAITGSTVSPLAPGSYEVRLKATASAFASEAASVTIGSFSASPEATPTAAIDYTNETLTGLTPNASYTFNGAAATADSNGKVTINSLWLGSSVSIVKKGDGSTTTDSSAQSLAVPLRPTAPNGVGKTNETAATANDGSLTGVSSTMEYRLGSSGPWTAITGSTVSPLAPGSYEVRLKATASAFASAAASVTIGSFSASPEATPTAAIDYTAEMLTGLTPNASYTFDSVAVTADANGKVTINPLWLGSSVSIIKKGNGSSTTDSLAQSLAVPTRPVAPTGLSKTDETSTGNNGTISGVNSSMEYRKGNGSWMSVSGTSLTGLAPDTYEIRFKATASAFASAAASVTIGSFSASPEATPTAAIDYTAETLTGLTPNASYTFDSVAVTADANGKVTINPLWLGSSVSIIKKGDGSTTTDSSAQSLAVPLRPVAPNGVGKTNETAATANDGSLTGVSSAMEYRLGSSGPWTAITGSTVSPLAPGTYYVRVAATNSSFASAETSATIGAFNTTPEATPTAIVDYTAEKLTGLTPNAAYKIDNQSVTTDAEGKLAIQEAWLGLSLSIVKVGDGTTTTDSSAQTLSLPARPLAPIGLTKTDETVAGASDGTLNGVGVDLEYRKGANGTWTSGTGSTIIGLAPDTYSVRIKATANSFASASADLTIQAGNGAVPAAGLTVTATDPSGASNDGKTQLTVTPAPSGGHTLVYILFVNGQVVTPNVGATLTGYSALPNNGLVSATNGSLIGVAELDAQGKVVRFGTATAVVTAEPSTPGGGSGSGSNPSTGGTTSPTTGTPTNPAPVIVLVNGREENAGNAVTTTTGAVTTTAITVDSSKIQERLNAEGNGAVVTIPVTSTSDVVVGKLNGQIVKNMENQNATLVLLTNKASYTLPAAQIDIDSLAQTLGSGANLQSLELQVAIGNPDAAMVKVVNDSAVGKNLTLVAPPLDFTVTATYNGKTAEVNNFNAYVKRSVALPAGIDPSRITTGTVVDPDGTVRHVPTKITLINGVYYAEINSLTNSTYSVVWHPLTFADVENHWAKESVNDMGSRLVINGVSDTRFDPNADITRAEFAAIIVRGLGLKLSSGDTGFSDIGSEAWYASAVKTASAYGLITGFEDGTFRPDAKITREQAMNIVAKAMKLTGLQAKVGAADASVLSRFADADQAGTWAKENMALTVKAGLITGRDGGKLEAKAQVTRAEVAVLIRRLLQNSDLID